MKRPLKVLPLIFPYSLSFTMILRNYLRFIDVVKVHIDEECRLYPYSRKILNHNFSGNDGGLAAEFGLPIKLLVLFPLLNTSILFTEAVKYKAR